MLLELHDDLNGHVEDAQFGLRLVRLQMRHAHAPQFLERFVDIPNSDPVNAPPPSERNGEIERDGQRARERERERRKERDRQTEREKERERERREEGPKRKDSGSVPRTRIELGRIEIKQNRMRRKKREEGGEGEREEEK